ncbi:hypothetical protein L486_02848 [Kwoniella mangroviensis CBS 10435]|uniref:Btz domain-containing protein n=1 Tax=Kwoniella mangroviensis CBS 10435 TaxID=1331196 RepID=A0A1B9IXB6_9TREE|nr:hypothetical protein L486_02848 [Kwoniella mangroviensis CBS 10435]
MTDNAPIDTQLTKDTPSSDVASSPVPAPINPSASPSTQPVSLPPASASSTEVKSPTETKAKTKSKGKGRKTKARPRRRVADSESEREDGAASDGSLTDPSSASDSEPESEEEEEEDEEEEVKKKQDEPQPKEETGKPPVDTDKSGSPAKVTDNAKGKGKGKVGPNGVKREYTEEENKRYQEMKARRKEKQKAKRAELKETKRKEKESAKAGTDGKVKNKEIEADEENTVPLVADGSPPPSQSPVLPNQKGRRGSKSQRRQSVVDDDPKVVPRQGKFWTHDQRSDLQPQSQEAYSAQGGRGLPDWRGRGGFRGGFRGRGGRGFANNPSAPFGRFQQQNGTAQGQELTAETPVESEKEDGDEPVLAMDRLEKELAKKEKSQSASTTVPTQPKEKKWGHEAFEQIQTEKKKKPVVSPAVAPRGGFRGVPRGRGRGFGPRGGHFGQPFRQPLSSLPFHPANLAANAAAAAKSASSASVTPAPAPASAVAPTSASTPLTQTIVPLPKAEQQSTRPDADDLLDESSQAVTIKLPGSTNTVEVAVSHPSEQNSAPAEVATESVTAAVKTPELNASGQAILYTSPVPPPQPVPTQQSQYQPQVSAPPPPTSMYPNGSAPSPFQPGSENGSMSSAGISHSQFIPTHPYPPQKSHLQQNVGPTPSGYGMGSEFVPSSRPPQVHLNGNNGPSRPFYPSGAPRSYPAQNQNQTHRPPIQPFYPSQPQSFEYAQSHSQRGSFSGSQQFYPAQQVHVNGYIDGRESPYNGGSLSPYPTGNGQMNYFAPARPSQKIQIKSPSASTSGQANDKGDNDAGQPTFASLTTTSSNHADMDNMMQGGYYPQHYNPYQTQTVNGYDERYYGMQQQHTGYENWQNGQQQGYTGYEGEYGY